MKFDSASIILRASFNDIRLCDLVHCSKDTHDCTKAYHLVYGFMQTTHGKEIVTTSHVGRQLELHRRSKS